MVFAEMKRGAALGAMVLAGLTLAACSSSGGTVSADGRSATSSAAVGQASSVSPVPSSGAPVKAAGAPTGDPCSVLTDSQVTAELDASTTLTAEGASKSEPWGCTWGSRKAYLAFEWVDDNRFALITSSPDLKVEPIEGIGDGAVLTSYKDDGRRPEVVFTVKGRHYSIEAVADRGATGATNAPLEAAAEQALARVAAAKL